MDIITLAVIFHEQKKRESKKYARHAKRNRAINMCKRLGFHWKANDNTIYIEEMDETFTHSQIDELIRRLNSLEPFYL